MMKPVLLLSLFTLLCGPVPSFASLDAPAIKLPADLEPAKSWRDDIVLEAHSPYARLRLTRLKSKMTVADHLSLNGRDADRLRAQGATVEPRLRAFTTAGGRRLLAIESTHREKPLFTGYVNGPAGSYAFLASGLTRTQVMKTVATLELPGERVAPELDPRIGAPAAAKAVEAAPLTAKADAGRALNAVAETAMPMPSELRDAPAALPEEDSAPQPALMYEPDQVSPWPQRFEIFLALTMFLVGLGFVWRLAAWAASRGKSAEENAPGSPSNLPPFRRSSVATRPLIRPSDDREPAGLAS